MKRVILLLVIALTATIPILARYKAKEINLKPAKEYPYKQDFQKIVIAAQPYVTQEETQELFDTKRLYERQIMPVLVVIQNNNDFAIRLRGDSIYFVDKNRTQHPPIRYEEVLLRISLNRPLTTQSTRPEVLLQGVNRDMRMDFEHKAFGEKLIAPHESDYGIVFYPRPEDANLFGSRIFIPEIYNLTENEQLIFFEFSIAKVSDEQSP
jgi:hypothetical protein